ncbi:hypothetical protein ACH5RR_039213 [Cinchona calisaya]|uniref:Uncharacterized protein n=1 Tax=Cinchona calisaya TaxID=153742 RepID=A0ABD2Y0G7_9GENT
MFKQILTSNKCYKFICLVDWLETKVSLKETQRPGGKENLEINGIQTQQRSIRSSGLSSTLQPVILISEAQLLWQPQQAYDKTHINSYGLSLSNLLAHWRALVSGTMAKTIA